MLVNIGKGIELNVPDFDSFSPEVREHVAYIGFRNILMDSHAGVTADKVGANGDVVAQSRAVAEKKLAALVNGEVRTTSSRETDPVRKEAFKLATARVEAAIKAKGKKVEDFDRKAISDKAREVIDKFMVQARKNVEAARAIEVEIDI